MDILRLNDLAKHYFDKKDFTSALSLLEKYDLPKELIPNLAKCYYYTNQADKALKCVLPLEKNQDLWIDIAIYYNALGYSDKSFEIYKSLNQNDYRVKFNLGWHYLADGDFKKGFEHIQHGDKCRAWGHEYLYIEKKLLNPQKRWQGDFVDHLLLILEGGLGDEIIFLRWAKYLESKCNTLTILCDKSLLRLLTNSGYNCQPDHVINFIDYDAYVPAMSLPAITEITHPQEFVEFPYIQSFSERYITKQLDQLAKGKKKIGVRFYGNRDFEHEQFRSPPRQAFENLSKYGQLFSLQLDDEDTKIPNCKHLIKDWQDTYSIFKGLDFLVTSCTSTAHLAGAMGIRSIVLVPLVPYFIWASKDLKWYKDNIIVIKQTKYNDWSEALEILDERVADLCDR